MQHYFKHSKQTVAALLFFLIIFTQMFVGPVYASVVHEPFIGNYSLTRITNIVKYKPISEIFYPYNFRKKQQNLKPYTTQIQSGILSNGNLQGSYKGIKIEEKVETSGPTQPEHSQFKPAEASNLVDLFTGDFSYNIPLLDVGGYPVSINYSSNVSMDQEASWVGLGWNINPGTISRNARGLPDDFNGKDSIVQTLTAKKQIAVGASFSFSPELVGTPLQLGLGISASYNNRTGFGVDFEINPSLSLSKSLTPPMAGTDVKDSSSLKRIFNVSAGLKLSNQEGAVLSPTFSSAVSNNDKIASGDYSITTNIGSRVGLISTSISTGYNLLGKKTSEDALKNSTFMVPGIPAGNISFAKNAAYPTITSPYNTRAGLFNLRIGTNIKVFHGSVNVSGNFSETKIDKEDETQIKPAFGYLHFSGYEISRSLDKIADVSRDKETYYKDKPLPYNIGIPSFNYDVYSISGEGTGGMFRPYRGDVGFSGDHYVKTKNTSVSAGTDIGFGSIFKGGVNVSATRISNTTRSWDANNGLRGKLAFDNDADLKEPVYFKNPGEMVVANQVFDSLLGKEHLVKYSLGQSVWGASEIYLRPQMDIYKNNRIIETSNISGKIIQDERQPRTQVITHFTVAEEKARGNDFLVSPNINYFHFGCAPDPNMVKYIPKQDSVIRKGHHIGAIEVLQTDGRTYEYGLPVYTLETKEVEYSLPKAATVNQNGLTETQVNPDYTILEQRYLGYRPARTPNFNATDQHFKRTITPAHANSFLLTSLKSPDYVDIKGDGPTEDDRGDAVKFNYSRVHYAENKGGFGWKTPLNESVSSSLITANVSEGLKTDYRDDRANYIYGRKEIWYLNSIESKTMVANFVLEERKDGLGIRLEYDKNNSEKKLYSLKEIRLFSRADLVKNGMLAKPIKVVHFQYDYSLCPGVPNSTSTEQGKLTLRKIWFTYNNNNKGEQNPYIFEYRNNQTFKRNWNDNWGNIKDPADNPGGLSNIDYPYPVNNAAAAKNSNIAPWALQSVRNPGGGAMKVTYEADDYAYVQNKSAMQMFEIVKLGKTSNFTQADLAIYENEQDANDHRYVFVKLPEAIASKEHFFRKYLEGLDYLYLRIGVKMPFDPAFDIKNIQYEFIKLYAQPESGQYGIVAGIAEQNIAWIKLKGTRRNSTGVGDLSPITKASLQFLRNQLPAKAYPGSQFPTDNVNIGQFANAMIAAFKSVGELTTSFIQQSKKTGKVKYILPGKAFIRLNHAGIGKTGGGYRVKKIEMYDRWDSMANGKASTYGQEYIYTTNKIVGATIQIISSGVASFEPFAGGEENPLRVPMEFYDDQRNLLGPATTVFTEGPLMESYYPAPIIGYSKVRVRSIHNKNIRSQTGWDETEFYTARDYPVITEDLLTPLADGFRKFESPIRNFFKINSKRYYAFSQGFKIELNDMHGKMKSQASYAYGDSVRPFKKSTFYYNATAYGKGSYRLNSEVAVSNRKGEISNRALGRNLEIMTDLRNQESEMFSGGLNSNFHFFFIGPFPILIPRLLKVPQWEETYYRAAAVTKVVNKTGILDSVIVVDKGSVVSTRNLVYDELTGQVVITRTNNEFDDPVFNFNMPAYWAYDRMGPAYANMKAKLIEVEFTNGRIGNSSLESFFVPGDEVIVTSPIQPKGLRLWVTAPKTGTADKSFDNPVALLPNSYGNYSNLLFVTSDGKPFSTNQFGFPDNGFFPEGLPLNERSNKVKVNVVRSGRRNQMAASVGSVQSLQSPIKANKITIDSTIKILNASAVEMKEDWRVRDNYWVIDACNKICNCPDSFTLNEVSGLCERVLEQNVLTSIDPNIRMEKKPNNQYNRHAVRIFNSKPVSFWDNSPNVSTLIHIGVPFWDNFSPWDTVKGRLNKVGLWSNEGGGNPFDKFIGFVANIDVPATKEYFIGISADNHIMLKVDCDTIINSKQHVNNSSNFRFWNVFPVILSKGRHTLELTGLNTGSIANFGAEVYDNTREEIMAFKGFDSAYQTPLRILFSTANFENQPLHVYEGVQTCPTGYCMSVGFKGQTMCLKVLTATPNCVSQEPILDTLPYVNTYNRGILGNYRPHKSYVYYANRTETNPSSAINIRNAGTISDFNWFWKSENGWFKPNYHTNWLANVENTLYDRRGMSIETKDALNRFTAGQYGYQNTLPVSVTQNSKARESAFEGFEDYDYSVNPCVDTCEKRIRRHFDWSLQKVKIIDSAGLSHTGRNAIHVANGDTAWLEADLSTISADTANIWIRTTEAGFTKTNDAGLLPLFSPTKGDSILVSIWLKESVYCSGIAYENSDVQVAFFTPGVGGSTIETLSASGPIIEGWQRFEAVVAVPTNYNRIRINLLSNGALGTFTYFDDLRVHPYYANMKSFVYDPVSLRLMAELDENNYATFFEYDDDGTLIRVKKETERGIKTIKETRSALLKQ